MNTTIKTTESKIIVLGEPDSPVRDIFNLLCLGSDIPPLPADANYIVLTDTGWDVLTEDEWKKMREPVGGFLFPRLVIFPTYDINLIIPETE